MNGEFDAWTRTLADARARASRSSSVTSPSAPLSQRAAGQLEDPRRSCTTSARSAASGRSSSSRTSRSWQTRERGLEADDAERREVELDVLLVEMVRRVVGRDDVDGAVGDRLEDRLDGAPRERSGGFIFRFVENDCTVLVGEREVVRRGFAGDAEPVLLRPPHRVDARRASKMCRRARAPPVSSARITSRAISDSSEAAGMPRMPRSVEIIALVHDAALVQVGSSSCAMTGMPSMRAYSSARRISCAFCDRLAVVAERDAAGRRADRRARRALRPSSPRLTAPIG